MNATNYGAPLLWNLDSEHYIPDWMTRRLIRSDFAAHVHFIWEAWAGSDDHRVREAIRVARDMWVPVHNGHKYAFPACRDANDAWNALLAENIDRLCGGVPPKRGQQEWWDARDQTDMHAAKAAETAASVAVWACLDDHEYGGPGERCGAWALNAAKRYATRAYRQPGLSRFGYDPDSERTIAGDAAWTAEREWQLAHVRGVIDGSVTPGEVAP